MPYPSKTDRNSILLAAVEEISHSGIRDLSLRNLASLLGLAPTALYRYFSNRAELELLSPTNAHGDLKMCSGMPLAESMQQRRSGVFPRVMSVSRESIAIYMK
jgi:hypothetical protein